MWRKAIPRSMSGGSSYHHLPLFRTLVKNRVCPTPTSMTWISCMAGSLLLHSSPSLAECGVSLRLSSLQTRNRRPFARPSVLDDPTALACQARHAKSRDVPLTRVKWEKIISIKQPHVEEYLPYRHTAYYLGNVDGGNSPRPKPLIRFHDDAYLTSNGHEDTTSEAGGKTKTNPANPKGFFWVSFNRRVLPSSHHHFPSSASGLVSWCFLLLVLPSLHDGQLNSLPHSYSVLHERVELDSPNHSTDRHKKPDGQLVQLHI